MGSNKFWSFIEKRYYLHEIHLLNFQHFIGWISRKIALGAFNNYVDQILPNFDPTSPLADKKKDILHTIYPLSRYIPPVDILHTT